MVDREVNPVESRHMQLSARFKAAWAFHQLLVGMDRMGAIEHFENKSDDFQSLFSRLREVADSSRDPTASRRDLDPELILLEKEINGLILQLEKIDRTISPSGLRLFFQRIRSLDERILIEIIRFYIEIQRGKDWSKDRLDKADYVLSRLADLIAGPGLKGDRNRLNKVLRAISGSLQTPPLDDDEVQQLREALNDQKSEVRWIKSFEELNESRRIDLYRALKHEMGEKIFYPTLLPLVVEVNGSFRARIEELRDQAEARLAEDFQRLSGLHKKSGVPESEITVELEKLEHRVEEFRSRIKESNIRLSELVDLARDLDEIAERYEARFEDGAPEKVPPPDTSAPAGAAAVASRQTLIPVIESLQPYWSEVYSELSGIDEELAAEEAVATSTAARFRLEPREYMAFRRLSSSTAEIETAEQFIFAAAVLRRRVLHNVAVIREVMRSDPGEEPAEILSAARATCRLADAYIHHFEHLIGQAVFDGNSEEARNHLIMKTRLVRDVSGLMILVQRLS